MMDHSLHFWMNGNRHDKQKKDMTSALTVAAHSHTCSATTPSACLYSALIQEGWINKSIMRFLLLFLSHTYTNTNLTSETSATTVWWCFWPISNNLSVDLSLLTSNTPSFGLTGDIILTKQSVKGVSASDELPENYQLNLQLLSALWSFIVSFSSLFICLATT